MNEFILFYELNKIQSFEFPHNNCDEYTNDQLLELYFKQSGYGPFCKKYIEAHAPIGTQIDIDLEKLRHNSQFVNYVIAWMRLKFIAEQVDPVRYTNYFRHFTSMRSPRLPSYLQSLYKSDSTEFYSYIDNLTNSVQISWIQMMLGKQGDVTLDNKCTLLNSKLPTIRSCDLGEYKWKSINPYELPLLPFLTFHSELRRLFV